MGKFIDLTGQQFGRLTVLGDREHRGKELYWLCQCSCGQQKYIAGRNLRGGQTKSCGCLNIELSTERLRKATYKDITGQKFNHLTAIKDVGADQRGEHLWECECDCGNPNHIIVLSSNLRSGHTSSCGCERRSHGEQKIEQLLRDNNISYEAEKPMFKYANGYNAKFDFFVDKTYLIEYDGETHYNSSLHGWHCEEQLKAQQQRDMIKNEWCKEHNIPLIRIPYTRFKDLCIEDLQLDTTQFREC